jgi:hypothetical protein
VNIPLNVFDFTVSRHRDGPDLMLAEFMGTLLADCYSGYQGITLRSDGRIRRAACNAHARRKIFDAREVYPLESSAVLAKYQQLYDIEDRVRSASVEERLALRQTESVAVWRSLGEWLESKPAADVLPKSKLGEALGYLRNHWEPLQTYLNDGRVPMDNNEVEQLMKQVAIGRNYAESTIMRSGGPRTRRFPAGRPVQLSIIRGSPGTAAACRSAGNGSAWRLARPAC